MKKSKKSRWNIKVLISVQSSLHTMSLTVHL